MPKSINPVSESESHSENFCHPSCYLPEENTPYPLCVGNGSEECKECCLYAKLERYINIYNE